MDIPFKLPKPVGKRVWLKEQLEKRIAGGKEGDRLPTFREIIRDYDVTQGTIELALERLSAEGKIERRGRSGVFITKLGTESGRKVRQRSLGAVLEWDVRRPFENRLIERCRARALTRGARFTFYLHVPDEAEAAPPSDLVEDIESGKLEGVLLLGMQHQGVMDLLDGKEVPHALFSAGSAHTPRVEIDYTHLIQHGVSALTWGGCRRIGLISNHEHGDPASPRQDVAVFKAALEAEGLEFIPEAVIERPTHPEAVSRTVGETGLETGYWAAGELFGGAEPNRHHLDGVVVMDESYTQGMIFAFEKLGLHAQTDIQIATHSSKDGSPLQNIARKLILLELDVEAVVDALFQTLEDWTRDGIRPQRIHRVPISLRLPAVPLNAARSGKPA